MLDNPRRNVANALDPANPLCDSKLKNAWYKMELDGLPAELPTECPPVDSCGTQFQTWLRPDSRPAFSEERVGSVFATWMTKEKKRICCLWEIPVNITHCGGFVVYHLRGTQECHVGYCAKGVYWWHRREVDVTLGLCVI